MFNHHNLIKSFMITFTGLLLNVLLVAFILNCFLHFLILEELSSPAKKENFKNMNILRARMSKIVVCNKVFNITLISYFCFRGCKMQIKLT